MREIRYRRAPKALHRSAGHEVLLAAADRDVIDLLPGAAATLWSLLDRPASLETLTEELSFIYETPVQRVTADVAPLLDELVRREWLELVDDED
jgi:Coenzyme PQQ synthesis protein D (PqqD)